jgi:hypothetical protein
MAVLWHRLVIEIGRVVALYLALPAMPVSFICSEVLSAERSYSRRENQPRPRIFDCESVYFIDDRRAWLSIFRIYQFLVFIA